MLTKGPGVCKRKVTAPPREGHSRVRFKFYTEGVGHLWEGNHSNILIYFDGNIAFICPEDNVENM